MADHTIINFAVPLDHEPSDDDLARVQAITEHYEPIDLDVDFWSPPDGQTWTIGGCYCEGIPEEADHIAVDLHDAFPDAIEVRCWDEPKYEWLGTVTVYRRGDRASVSASCNAEGTAVYTAAEVLETVAQAKADHEPDPAIALAAVIEAVRALAI